MNVSLTSIGNGFDSKLILFDVNKLNSYEIKENGITLAETEKKERIKDSLIVAERIKNPMDSIEMRASDELTKAKKRPLNIFLDKFLQLAISGYLNLGYIDFGPYFNVYRHTVIEGHRFCLPLRTSEQPCKNFSFGGYLAYATRSKEFGYSVKAQYKVATKQRFILTADYTNDYYTLSEHKFMRFIQENPYSQGTGNIISNITPIAANPYMIQRSIASINIEYDINKIVGFQIKPSYERYSANRDSKKYMPYVKFSKDGKSYDYFDTQTLLMNFRFSADQSFEETYFSKVYYGNNKPIFNVSLLAGRYNLQYIKRGNYFANLNLSMKWRVSAGPILFISLVEAGGILGKVPYPLLDMPMGSRDLGSARFHYNLLNHASIASDIYAKLHLTINTGGILFNRIPLIKKLNLREIFGIKLYYGAMLGNHSDVMDIPSFLRAPTYLMCSA